MNIQTDPKLLQTPAHHFPPAPEQPIRDEYLHEDRLRALGESLARNGIPSLFGMETFDFQKRVRENAAKILDVYLSTNAAQTRGEMVTPAAQWLLDNNYLVEETIFQIKRDLPRRFYRELPTMTLPDGTTVPRALALAWVYVAHSDSTVAAHTFKSVVEGFQAIEPMKIGELWALPSLLRFVLVENLRRIAVRVNRARQMRQIANEVADRVLATPDDEGDRKILADYSAHARDTTFATQLLYRLRDGSQNSGKALNWLEKELETSGTDAEEIIIREHHTLSSGNVTTGNIVRGLRLINDIEWTDWFEDVSRIDALLRERTDIAALDFASRDQYRQAIEDLARRSNLSEFEVAEKATQLAGYGKQLAAPDGARNEEAQAGLSAEENVGFLLVGSRREELEKAIGYRPGFGRRLVRAFRATGWTGIVVPVFLLTVLLMVMAGSALETIGLPGPAIALLLVLFAVPASEGALAFFNTVVLLFLKPTRLVGYEFKQGVPAEARTLVVVPTLIGSRDDVEETVRKLEVHHLANMTGELHFALLSDWPDSDVEQSAADEEILDFARAEIEKLNQRYPVTNPAGSPRFYLLHRRRLYNQSQRSWMGWERKRGKLHELNLLLRGDPDTTFLPDVPLPQDVVYVMTLDADTRMMRDAVDRLVGKLCHPLNRPVIDGGEVVTGYSILQPRVTPSLTTGDEASFLQRVFSANRGIDPYVFAVSDLYQDVFGEGSFTGKGLYHIDAVETALSGRIAENEVLSHDLLEGSLARSALVTDVEVVEDYPTRYSVDASRQHRWARGDWQLLGYIFSPKSGVPALSRWKMVDNLRRTLTPIFWVMAAVAGWTLLPFTQAAQWQALLVLALFMAPTFDIVDSILPKSREATARGHFTALARDAAFGTALVALRIVLMAHSAWMMGDAIVRTLYRMFVSRQNLLEWRTASQAYQSRRQQPRLVLLADVRRGDHRLRRTDDSGPGRFHGRLRRFLLLPLLGGFAGLRLADQPVGRDRGPPACVAGGYGGSAHHRASHLGLFRDLRYGRAQPSAAGQFSGDAASGRGAAGPRRPMSASICCRSSRRATSAGSAWPTRSRASTRRSRPSRRWSAIAATSTTGTTRRRSGRSTRSTYRASTAAISPAIWSRWPLPAPNGRKRRRCICRAISTACSTASPSSTRTWPSCPTTGGSSGRSGNGCATVSSACAGRSIRSRPSPRWRRSAPSTWPCQASEIRKLAVAIDTEAKSARSAELAEWAARLEATCEAHVQDAHIDDRRSRMLRTKLLALRERCRQFAFEMDFSFLLRKDRKLLSIGYRVEEHQLDESCYDLLASEARLTSLFAIAKGDLPTEHWFRLGRPIVEIGFRGALMSWSGSMFEYLMPPLVMKEPQGGILNQTSHLIIKRQIQYGRSKRIPWGISEAAYNARDREMTYQYTNFGVPGLGLKRGLGQNTVIAPYATVLAAQFMPREAVENLERLTAIGALGHYGFYDAVDFTPQRVPEGTDHAVVYNYMAHHQGMSIVAVANAIFEGRMRDRFHSDPVIEAAELLLQEKAPRDIPIADRAHRGRRTRQGRSGRAEPGHAAHPRSGGGAALDQRDVERPLFGDGDGDRLRLQPLGRASRSRAGKPTRPRTGSAPTCSCATPRPANGGRRRRAEEARRTRPAQTLFSDDKASFVKTVGTLRSEVECIVVSEGNGEGRRVTIWNDGDATASSR